MGSRSVEPDESGYDVLSEVGAKDVFEEVILTLNLLVLEQPPSISLVE